jgi:hypothetical protein
MRRAAIVLSLSALGGVLAVMGLPTSQGGEPQVVHFYSTARPPEDFRGPVPRIRLAVDRAVVPARIPRPDDPARPAATEAPAAPAAQPSGGQVTRIANAATDASTATDLSPAHVRPGGAAAAAAADRAIEDPTVRAQRMVASCRESYRSVTDYTCTFYKRERIGGYLLAPQKISMKVRSTPFSVYLRFIEPHAGREAIFVDGRNSGKAVVHDVGINKLLAGTVLLDPRSRRAMQDNRHPITDAGIGHLIDTISHHWKADMQPGVTQVVITPGVRVGDRVCTMIDSTQPQQRGTILFHRVKVYIDQEHNVPIRFEAYDWPKVRGQKPELMEEYTYANLKLNRGLSERDFDPNNELYSFGRF